MTDASKDEATQAANTAESAATETAADAAATDTDVYSKEELADLTKALGQVVLGAGMSEKSGAFGLMREIMAAMSASASFVGESSSPLLQQIVTNADPSDMDDAEKDAGANPNSAQKAIDDGIAAAQRTHELLLAKGSADDADAWAQLLLTAANAAVQATKTGGFLGFGGEKVTASEQAYMQRLADTLGYKKES
jgi:hypothetical protein